MGYYLYLCTHILFVILSLSPLFLLLCNKEGIYVFSVKVVESKEDYRVRPMVRPVMQRYLY